MTYGINQTNNHCIPVEWKFGKSLKQARESRCLTQEFVAERAGITVQMISAYENHRQMPSLNTVRALCRAIGTSADELLGFIEHASNSDS